MARFVLIFLLLVLAAGPAAAGYPECDEVYPNGSFVSSKLTGLKGMVVSHWRTGQGEEQQTARYCGYNVRFVTDSGWVYTIEKMRGYELKKYVPIAAPEKAPTPTNTTPYFKIDQVRELDFGG